MEKGIRQSAESLFGDPQCVLGPHWSDDFRNDPTHLVITLSRYKFAAKMAGQNTNVLEIGCGEGIGSPILSEFANSYTGVDLDADAIDSAQRNWGSTSRHFYGVDLLSGDGREFDSIVSLCDTQNHHLGHVSLFVETVKRKLSGDGICLIGMPNILETVDLSETVDSGYGNPHDAVAVRESMDRLFHNVFSFGMNHAIIQAGIFPKAGYSFFLGCYKK